jgi:hypothetical protein
MDVLNYLEITEEPGALRTETVEVRCPGVDQNCPN